jgi:c-di-GMP-binding flagellar brake protein YcgR
VRIEKAFPKSRSKVYRIDEKLDADYYVITRVRGKRLCLEARADTLEQPIPEVGEEVCVLSLRPEAAYEVPVKVESCFNARNHVCVIAVQDGEIRRIQRRRFFRVPAELDVAIAAPELNDGEPLALTTRDISAGGCSFRSPGPIAVGALLHLYVRFPGDARPLRCRGRVRRCRPLEDGACECGVSFEELTEKATDELMPILMDLARAHLNL